jgi:hypothetical protein
MFAWRLFEKSPILTLGLQNEQYTEVERLGLCDLKYKEQSDYVFESTRSEAES